MKDIKLRIIAAGYKDEIEKCFFSVNEGLRRRFQWVHNIEDYQPEDLTLILKLLVTVNLFQLFQKF